jgi:hypothetical protein
MYQDVIAVVVQNDADPKVRKTALEQALTLRDVAPKVFDVISRAASDPTRPGEERQLAQGAVRQIGLSSAAPSRAYLLSSTLVEQTASDSSRFGGGLFTHYLLQGLAGGADFKHDGNVSILDLGRFVTSNVQRATKGAQIPLLILPVDSADPIIVGPGRSYERTVVVSIGMMTVSRLRWLPNLNSVLKIENNDQFKDTGHKAHPLCPHVYIPNLALVYKTIQRFTSLWIAFIRQLSVTVDGVVTAPPQFVAD